MTFAFGDYEYQTKMYGLSGASGQHPYRICALNVYGSTGNKQTNIRTSAFYKGMNVCISRVLRVFSTTNSCRCRMSQYPVSCHMLQPLFTVN